MTYPNLSDGVGSSAAAAPQRSWHRRAARYGFFSLVILLIAYGLVTHRPRFYRQLSDTDPEKRNRLSKEFNAQLAQWINDLKSKVWEARFQQDQINAWLADDFETNFARTTLAEGVYRPRVALEKGIIRLGFEYHNGVVPTIIQVRLRPWVPEANLLALQLEGASVGAIPLPTNMVRQAIEHAAIARDLEPRWYRQEGKLVVLLRFDRSYRERALHMVEVANGAIRLKGISGRIPYTRATSRGDAPLGN